MKTRVAHVITMLELGGAQENTLHTVRHLSRERFEVALITGSSGLLVPEARAIPELSCHFLDGLVRELRPGKDWVTLRALARLFRRERYDIVHTHSSKAGILGRLAARRAGVPIVIHSIHGFGFNRFQAWPVRAAYIAAERRAARFTTHFIAVSQANLAEGLELGLYPAERVTLIRSGIPIKDYAEAAPEPEAVRAEFGFTAAAPLVTMVACLKPQKDPLSFVDVAGRVAAACPEARFLLAGDGLLREEALRRVAELGLAGRLVLAGWRRDVPRLIAASDVVVLTSLWEGLPRVIPQAMAAGKPVVATAVDGSPEAVVEGETGFLVAPRDVVTAARRVAQLLGDKDLSRRMGAAARTRVAEWDIERMVPAQEALYGRLLSNLNRLAA